MDERLDVLRFVVKDRNTDMVSLWSLQDILDEINRDRSEEWSDYDASDWREGWEEWCEHDPDGYELVGEFSPSFSFSRSSALTLYGVTGEPLVHIIRDCYQGSPESLPVRSLMGLFDAVSNGESTLEYREVF